MNILLRETIIKSSRKQRICMLSREIFSETNLIDFSDEFNLNEAEFEIMKNVKNSQCKILIGEPSVTTVAIVNGDFVVSHSRKDVYDICQKYKIFEE